MIARQHRAHQIGALMRQRKGRKPSLCHIDHAHLFQRALGSGRNVIFRAQAQQLVELVLGQRDQRLKAGDAVGQLDHAADMRLRHGHDHPFAGVWRRGRRGRTGLHRKARHYPRWRRRARGRFSGGWGWRRARFGPDGRLVKAGRQQRFGRLLGQSRPRQNRAHQGQRAKPTRADQQETPIGHPPTCVTGKLTAISRIGTGPPRAHAIPSTSAITTAPTITANTHVAMA